MKKNFVSSEIISDLFVSNLNILLSCDLFEVDQKKISNPGTFKFRAIQIYANVVMWITEKGFL